MRAAWVVDEMRSADLKDKRLNERLETLLSALGERPTASIPAACGGFNETIAAYRFFDNPKVTAEAILAPHAERTLMRMAEQEVVLLVQDTTDLDFTRPQQQMQGAGSLGSAARWGAFLHPLVAFTVDGTPLGTCWAQFWTREPPAEETRRQKEQRRKATPLEQKESQRWIAGLQQARQVAQQLPSVQCICLADSEGDIYEWFAEPRGARPVEWLVRACQNRALLASAGEADPAASMREAVAAQPVLFTKEVLVRGRVAKMGCIDRKRESSRSQRRAQFEVRAACVTLRPPQRPGGEKLPAVSVNLVQARESHPPAGEEPVEWLLVTTLPINTPEQVRQILDYYTVRFLIELLFRVLKSGCRVEERRFEHIERMLPCAALYLIVAWRTLMLCRLARSCPEINCEVLFDPAEWQAVWMVVHRQPPPSSPPTLGAILPLIAQLGGYIARRRDPPGPQTVWLGLQRTHDLAVAWNTFGPGASRPTHPPTYV